MKRQIFVSLVFILVVLTIVGCSRTTSATTVPDKPASPPQAETQQTAPTQGKAPAAPTQAKVSTAAAPQPAAGSTDAKALFENKCSGCHGLNRATRERNSADGWNAVVSDMVSRGADITPDQQVIIVKYLAETYK